MRSLHLRANEFVSAYDAAKPRLAELLGASEALLHVHVGLLIFVLAALVTRRHMASPWPLAVVFALALINELIDYLGPTPSAYLSSVGDVINTVFWPTVLFLIARRGSFRTKV